MTQIRVDELHAELSRKEDALVLAASYGKSLLEENERVKRELETALQECTQLEKLLQSQRQDAQRTLLQAKAEADECISDLEYQLKCTKTTLKEEQENFACVKDELLKEIEDLQLENSELKDKIQKLTKERSKESEKCLQMKQTLKEFESQGQRSSIDSKYQQLQKTVESLQDSNKSYSTNVSTLAHTCDKLSDELQVARSQVEYWESQYSQLNDEYHTRGKELEDSQDLIRQLQLQVEQQREAMMSPSSNMSLHDELSQSNSSLHMLSRFTPDDLSSADSDNSDQIADHIEQACPETEYQSVTGTLRVADHPHTLFAWSPDSENSETPYLCDRCRELSEQVDSYKQELKGVNEQLLIAVQQKFELQQQNEEWQSDMAELVEKQLHHKLHREKDSKKKQENKTEKGQHKKRQTDSKNSDNDHSYSYHFIKDSWLF